MEVKVKIVKGKYFDSVKLMLISKELRSLPNIEDAVAILATKENKDILAATEMLTDEVKLASDKDIVIIAKGTIAEAAQTAIDTAEMLMNKKATTQESGMTSASNIGNAVLKLGKADLCLISVAGRYAAAEAEKALKLGLHVLLFSDNVSLDDELKLKQLAVSQGLLMMGPDCGTAIINGVPLAFANVVPRGEIGIVSASGTGLQEVSAGIAHRGCGISQAFGTGGRDGKKEIGGIMLSACLEYLIADPETEVIVLLAKTPDTDIQKLLWQQISACPKPVIVNFLKPIDVPEYPNIQYCTTLDGTAELAFKALHGNIAYEEKEKTLTPTEQPPKIGTNRKYIRGLYSGGTLCYEALELYKQVFGYYPQSNIASDPAYRLKDVWTSEKDTFIDMGADEFTVGRPHPMIDFDLRLKRIAEEAVDPETAIIMLDVVLGYGSHPDPAAELVPAIKAIPKDIIVICHILGTDQDPQNTERQIKEISSAGAKVFTAHHPAIAYALKALQSHREEQ